VPSAQKAYKFSIVSFPQSIFKQINLFLNVLAKSRPAFEKTLSLETDVAGIERKIRASRAKSGNRGEFTRHHEKTSAFLSGRCRMIALYWASWVSIVESKSASNSPDNVDGTETVPGDFGSFLGVLEENTIAS
jgi:hypothetical protein